MSDKKEKIFDAVFDAMLDTGDISSVTVSEVARRAGIGKGSVYMHFASKEQMFFEAVRYFVGSTMKAIINYPVDDSKGFKENMIGFLAEHIKVIKKYSTVFYAAAGSNNCFTQLPLEFRKNMVNTIDKIKIGYGKKMEEFIAMGAAEKIVAKQSSPFAVMATSQMLFSAAGHFSQKDMPVISTDMDEYVLMMYDMAVKMLS